MQRPPGGPLDPPLDPAPEAHERTGGIGELFGLHGLLQPCADGSLHGVESPAPQRLCGHSHLLPSTDVVAARTSGGGVVPALLDSRH